MTWETVRVSDAAEQIRGVTYSKGEASNTAAPDRVALLRAGNITDSGVDLNDLTYVPAHRVAERQRLRVGDVLIAASSGSLSVVGKAAYIHSSPNATFGAFCKVLRPGPGVDPAYFAHYFRTAEYRRYISSVAAGANINNLRSEDLDRIEIPLPPLPEQRRIAAILDEAEDIRAQTSRMTSLFAEVPRARFQAYDQTEWRPMKVGDVAELQGGLTINARRASFPLSVGYLRVANVFRGSIDLGEVKELGVTDAELVRTQLRTGDVLVVEGHGNVDEVGRAALVDSLPDAPLTHQNHLFRLRPKLDVTTGRFLELSVNAPAAREHLRRVANTTSGLNTLNATSVRNLPIRIAPVDVQREIDAEFAEIMLSLQATKQKESALNALFASLQHRAFRGEL
ncbi:restriction endonuclease subunit S [Microbacterium jejuense]|uniref:Restriction endonuclease subunit S n=1 Tax=Microbacterium jejuense TaxID=1263637 RepID=A0ABS7HRB0_9MICO|nr:restriction endonuclease subunit S [Microbacterium jejuense]MBW9094433.1 restriction endonuclease subunit S [Microbacterium jejuense]